MNHIKLPYFLLLYIFTCHDCGTNYKIMQFLNVQFLSFTYTVVSVVCFLYVNILHVCDYFHPKIYLYNYVFVPAINIQIPASYK